MKAKSPILDFHTDSTAMLGQRPNDCEDDQPIVFPRCPYPTIGIELEVSLVDPVTRQLTPRAPEILEHFKDASWIKSELFQTIVELNTGVCERVEDVYEDLNGRIQQLQGKCREMNIACLSTGTHPMADWRYVPITDNERYQKLVDRMQWPARQLLICGLHVHIGVRSGEHAVVLMNTLSVFVPHLLALSASSPYWHGIDTGMASCRTRIFEALPTAGIPPPVANWAEFTSLMRTLMHAGSISSIREVWWDIRPHPTFGTIEIRICDAVNTLTEVCAIAAFVQCLTTFLQDRYDNGEPLPSLRYWTLRDNKWRASRYGEAAQIIRNECGEQVSLLQNLQEWVERLRPVAKRLKCEKELLYVLTMMQQGPSYMRQRRVFERTNSFEAVVDSLVQEFATDTIG